ncbi:MAG TPA: glycine reductase, partial [Synergistales bacterium]|nr:glycine reductase [Synergistales bacterium]
MATVGIKGYAYCLNHAPETGYHYGNTPHVERETKGETEFLKELPSFLQTYEDARDYAPNQAYIGGISLEKLEQTPQPWYTNRLTGSS